MITLEACSFCHKARTELFAKFNQTDTGDKLQHFDHGLVRFIIYHIQRDDIPRIHQSFGKHTFPMVFANDQHQMYYLGGSEVVTEILDRFN
jgi:hypothetical protein